MTYGRSGSTLVQGLLNSIPGYLIRGENSAALDDPGPIRTLRARCARVCGCESKPVAGETTHVRRPVVAEHGAA